MQSDSCSAMISLSSSNTGLGVSRNTRPLILDPKGCFCLSKTNCVVADGQRANRPDFVHPGDRLTFLQHLRADGVCCAPAGFFLFRAYLSRTLSLLTRNGRPQCMNLRRKIENQSWLFHYYNELIMALIIVLWWHRLEAAGKFFFFFCLFLFHVFETAESHCHGC